MPRRKRKSLSPRIRFRVFQRDDFTCRYCGRRAPDVVLHIDHVEPVALGGNDEDDNLRTACADCNLGKGVVQLEDSLVRNDDYAATLMDDQFAEEFYGVPLTI